MVHAPEQATLKIARDPRTSGAVLTRLARSADLAVVAAVAANPATPTGILFELARTPRIGIRRALLDSPRCPLVSSAAEDRLAYEGIDLGVFIDESSRRTVCRTLVGTGHRAEIELLFSDPSFRILDSLRTLQSLFTVHGGKRRAYKLNRHDYLRFLEGFNSRGGSREVLDLPFITLLTGIRNLGQERLLEVMTVDAPARAARCLRLLESVAGTQADEEGARNRLLLERWLARNDAAPGWSLRLHEYLNRKRQRCALHRRRRLPRALAQAAFTETLQAFNQREKGTGLRVYLPRSERDLQQLGARMANCIGSENNIDDAVAGRHLLLHAHPVRSRRRGVTCQFSSDGQLLQARGFANGDADVRLLTFARAAMAAILDEQGSLGDH
jgi:hypothetical protein